METHPFTSLSGRFLVVAVALAPASWAVSPAASPPSEKVERTGRLEVLYIDDFDHGRAEQRYVLHDARTRRPVTLDVRGRMPQNATTDAFIRIRGKIKDQQILLNADDPGSVEVLAPASTVVSGDQKTVVMVANFSDLAVACPLQDIQDRMFSDLNDQSVDDLYRETSNGNINFSGAVTGPYTINYTSTSACDLSGWTSAVEAQARANGVDLSAYQRKVYVMPKTNGCGYSGIGTVGGTPSMSWIFRCDLPDVFAHELGHALGMHHSGTAEGQYADISDIMGYSGMGLRQINGPHQEQMGWRTGEPVVEITGSGVYEISPLEQPPEMAAGPQIIKVRKPDTNEYYYLSYRQPLGFDSLLPAAYLSGVAIHRYAGSTGGSILTTLINTLSDGASYSDITNGITVTQLSHSSIGTTIQVDVTAACMRNPPTVAISPSSQTAIPGATINYNIAVTNIDTAACPSSVWNISSQLPTGWTDARSLNALTLAAGATGALTWSVTSPTMASDGTYVPSLTFTDPAILNHSTSGSAGYSVAKPADTSPPTVPTGLTGVSSRRQIQLGWNTATDNFAVAGYRIVRDGKIVATTSMTSYTDTAVAVGMTYRYAVAAFDAAGNVSAQSNQVAVTVKRK